MAVELYHEDYLRYYYYYYLFESVVVVDLAVGEGSSRVAVDHAHDHDKYNDDSFPTVISLSTAKITNITHFTRSSAPLYFQ